MDKGQLVTTGTVRELLATSTSAYFEVDDVDGARPGAREHARASAG